MRVDASSPQRSFHRRLVCRLPFRLEPTQEFPQSPSWSRFELRAAQIRWRPAGSWRIDGAILELRPRLRSRNNHRVSSDGVGGGQPVDGARPWRSRGGGGDCVGRWMRWTVEEKKLANQKLRPGGWGLNVWHPSAATPELLAETFRGSAP